MATINESGVTQKQLTAEREEAERYMRNIETIRQAFLGIDLALVTSFIRRRDQTPEADGFRPIGSGGSSGSSELTSTESAALRGLASADPDDDGHLEADDWRDHEIADPLQKAILEALADIPKIAGMAKHMHKRVLVVRNAASKLKGRPPLLDFCTCCSGEVTGIGDDRLRSGYCPACHRAWCRDGRPDRLPWEIRRRIQLAQNDDGDI